MIINKTKKFVFGISIRNGRKRLIIETSAIFPLNKIEKKTNEEERLIDSNNELINDKNIFKTTLILEVLSRWVKSFKRSFKAKNINLKNYFK
tara:strand:+ start:392 stop:667 length:276 start_codon:yes stop_codon:yes gene_type:complete